MGKHVSEDLVRLKLLVFIQVIFFDQQAAERSGHDGIEHESFRKMIDR